jgi:hypothetical protein
MNQATKFILKYSLYLLLLSSGAVAQPSVISTIAGGVPPATPAPALQIPIGALQGLAADSGGNVYFNVLDASGWVSMPGTWKMDSARSSFIGTTPPKSHELRTQHIIIAARAPSASGFLAAPNRRSAIVSQTACASDHRGAVEAGRKVITECSYA